MKWQYLLFLSIFLALVIVTEDGLMVRLGLKKAPLAHLSAAERDAIDEELAAAEFPPLLLERVTLDEVQAENPMFDSQLTFHFNRSLSLQEAVGFGRRAFFREPWHYAIWVRGKHELARFDPLNTYPVTQARTGKLMLTFHESTLHPQPFRAPREFAEYADATFRPGGLVDFRICLFRWLGYGDEGAKSIALEPVAEWSLGDLEAISEREWVVPPGFDSTPREATRELYQRNMNPPPIP